MLKRKLKKKAICDCYRNILQQQNTNILWFDWRCLQKKPNFDCLGCNIGLAPNLIYIYEEI